MKIREAIFLLLLFSYIMLRLYNTSWIVLGEMMPGFDVLTTFFENYGIAVIVCILYIINIIIDKTYFHSKTEIIKLLLFILFAIVSFEHITCLTVGAFLLCSDFSSIKKISIVSAAAIIAGTLCVIIASKTGWTGDYLVPRMDRNAHYFGFYHYAVWARQILFGLIFYLVARAKKPTLAELAIFALLQSVVFYYSTQRLTFVVSIFSIFVFIIFIKYEFIKINNKFISSLSTIAFPAAMLGTIWISLIYDESNLILAKINKMLSARLQLQKLTFEVFEPNLFGQQVHHVTDFYLFLDNGYLYALFAFGIVLTIAIICMLSYIMWRSCKKNDTFVFSLMVIILVYLLVDGPMTDMTFIGPALLFFSVFLKEHLSENKYK